MYNPTAGDAFEYIQLENRSGAAITLETTAGAWRIDGGVSYTFPSGFSLSAGSTLWLVSFDPSERRAACALLQHLWTDRL